ncbi:MAG: hypothetical protein WCP93_00615 [Candidatus Berkelbacteria bacterium]
MSELEQENKDMGPGVGPDGNFENKTAATTPVSVFAAERAKYGPEDGFNKLTDEENAKYYAEALDLPVSDKYNEDIAKAQAEYAEMSPAAQEMVNKYRNQKQ